MMEQQTEREKMLAGELYRSADPELVAARQRARRLTRLYNATAESEPDRRIELLRELFGRTGARFEVEPPFHCDYGENIHASDNLYVNFGCVFLDCNRITIGRNAFLGPGVHIYAATHPVDPRVRSNGVEFALPVKIGDDVWIGGGSVVCPGVTIGDGVTVGAGSVVTRDIPPYVVAVGNPCRILRSAPRR